MPALTQIGTSGIKDNAITTAKIVDGNVTTAKVADNNVTVGKLASSLDLSSKTVTVPSTTVTTHVTPTDLTPVKQDLALVAFDAIRAENRSALNMPNSFVDQFEDDTGIDTTTQSVRDTTSEYFTSTTPAAYGTSWQTSVQANWNTYSGANSAGNGTLTHSSSPDNDGLMITAGASTELSFPANAPIEWSMTTSNSSGYGPYFGFHQLSLRPTDNSGNPRNTAAWSNTTLGYLSGSFLTRHGSNAPATNHFRGLGGDWQNQFAALRGNSNQNCTYRRDIDGYFRVYDGLEGSGNLLGTSTHSNQAALFLSWGGTGSHAAAASNVKFRIGTAPVLNATGNFTCVNQTASSSVSSMSIVVMYENSSGTAALNTDLVAQVSANGGTNFTTVTLTAAPNLSSTIKVAKCDKVSVTAGTAPKYKINFANQSSGVKETRVLGVALLY